MKNKRLLEIASFVTEEDSVVDIGCDHGYLSIYLVENNLCQKVLATDISENALNSARKNIALKNLPIETLVSDGVEQIDIENYNTLVIAGMGTHTLIKILNNSKVKNIKKLILQSNNDLELLRKSVSKNGFCLIDNKVVYENNKYYEIMLFERNKKTNSKQELEFGILKKEYQHYYVFLIEKYSSIIEKLSKEKHYDKIKEYQDKIEYLKSTIF